MIHTFSGHRPAVALLSILTLVFGLPVSALAQRENFEMLAPLTAPPWGQSGNTATSGTHSAAAKSSVSTGIAPSNTGAASATFLLRPHCDSVAYRAAMQTGTAPGTPTADSDCPAFSVKDPQSKETPVLREGEPLDMDLLVHNPSGLPVHRFRAWIAYDPTAIEGELLDIAKTFPTPIPGETDFSVSDGYIKVSGSADAPQTGTHIVAARIRLHALQTTQSSVPITFYDATGMPASHTGIFGKAGSQESVLGGEGAGSLLVRITPSVSVSSTQFSVSSAPTGGASSVLPIPQDGQQGNSSAKPASGLFSMLQVKNLRVTTEGGSVFLAWNALPSSELVGYNLYYGTISGKYLQKRGIDKNTTTMTIRALPAGVTYYFAVRGVNAENQETDFSQEVGISVGKPETSTSPLTASSITPAPKTPRTGGNVSGETGPESTLLLFLAFSAVIGTALAFRRQLSAKV